MFFDHLFIWHQVCYMIFNREKRKFSSFSICFIIDNAMHKTCNFTHRCTHCYRILSQKDRNSNKSILDYFQKKCIWSLYIMYYQVYIFLTGENFRLDEALMITESSAYNFTHLMLGGIFHRIASGSDRSR